MPRFLSREWLDALDRAIDQSTALRGTARGRHLLIQQRVTDAPGGEATYHLHVDDGAIRVRPGAVDGCDVSFVTDYETAVAVNTGAASAQAAFMRGRLRLGGNVAALLRNADLFELLEDVFGTVRAETSY